MQNAKYECRRAILTRLQSTENFISIMVSYLISFVKMIMSGEEIHE